MKKMARISCCLVTAFCIFFTIIWAENNKGYAVTGEEISCPETELETATSENPKRIVTIIAKTYYDVPISEDDQDFIKDVCDYYGFSEKLIYQIMYRESGFNPNSKSSAGCYGIMQVSKAYYKSYLRNNSDGFNYIFGDDLSECDLYNLKHSVLLGIRILASYRDQCAELGLTKISNFLQAYNQGIGGYLSNPRTAYSKRILSTNIETYDVTTEVVAYD